MLLPLGAADIPPALDSGGLPSKEFSLMLMQSNPELVWQMIRKLYSLEHSEPVFKLPDLLVLERTADRGLVLGYQPDAVATFELGNLSYNIKYELKLKPTVLAGYREQVHVSVWWYIGGGVVLFLGGVVTGLSVSR
jgi:hypothetical protein